MPRWSLTPIVIAALAIPAAATAEAGDVGRMRAYHDGVVAAMKMSGGLAARAAAFEPLVRDYYDMPTIAALVVGPGWAQTGAADRAALAKALARHSAVSLARNFGSYGGERFAVADQVVDRGTSQLVTVRVGTDTLVYRLRRGRIVDVVSGGVSNLALQRADFASTLAKGGAAALVAKLATLDAVK